MRAKGNGQLEAALRLEGAAMQLLFDKQLHDLHVQHLAVVAATLEEFSTVEGSGASEIIKETREVRLPKRALTLPSTQLAIHNSGCKFPNARAGAASVQLTRKLNEEANAQQAQATTVLSKLERQLKEQQKQERIAFNKQLADMKEQRRYAKPLRVSASVE